MVQNSGDAAELKSRTGGGLPDRFALLPVSLRDPSGPDGVRVGSFYRPMNGCGCKACGAAFSTSVPIDGQCTSFMRD
ncbi:hypothetical protein NT2_16_00140 [Caenibius tardaugens NBRC 16725]|uniref:Uncharacterized protein n=1 Tax=Caenibius tardaugens NBRC 16725 TaxID=1219035 RepID=U3A8J1_9SPHN|nr:hypothetical protein NT2_16_00140 [Caenibius tardaugens NBRC 16725]